MDALSNAFLGLVFLGLSFASTFLMYKLWGYPFDHDKLKSSAPPGLMRLHRLIGYAYFVIYVYFMIQMVPRMWAYQVELPARTVAHLVLGMTIGAILIAKLAIVRFFKHMESSLVPILGTFLFICTFLLIGLSVPFALRTSFLAGQATGGRVVSDENIDRVKSLLPKAGFPSDLNLAEFASDRGFRSGRKVLLTKCVQCHDMRNVLVRPRTPANWLKTVRRMAERPILSEPINETEQLQVAAYLIAITPDLQRSAKGLREQKIAREESQAAVRTVSAVVSEPVAAGLDPAEAQEVFEDYCSSCHGLDNVESDPPETKADIQDIIERMVENGLDADEEEMELIAYYMLQKYVPQQGQ